MPRLNKELGHNVVDKRYGYGCSCGCKCVRMDGTQGPKVRNRASSVACADVCECAQVPCLAWCVVFVLSVTFFLLLVGLCTRVVGDYVCAHHSLTDLRVSVEHNPALHPFSTI